MKSLLPRLTALRKPLSCSSPTGPTSTRCSTQHSLRDQDLVGMAIVLVLLVAFPQIALWLPNVLKGA